MKKETMLHCLRNTYGIEANVMREARLQAADDLERLYKLEEEVKEVVQEVKNIKNFARLRNFSFTDEQRD